MVNALSTDGGAGDARGTDSSPAPDGAQDAAMIPTACAQQPTDLKGTWDLLGAVPGSPSESGLLTLQSDFLSIQIADTSLVFNGPTSPTTWSSPDDGTVPITVSQTSASAVSLGLLPLTLGGAWTFSNGSSQCNASLGTGAFSATCNEVDGLPEPLPTSLDGTASAQKTTSLPSIFADLGGAWHLTTQTGGCDATLSGNSLSVTCSGDNALQGSVEATFCQGAVNGQTNNGVTFTGRLQ